MPNTQVGAAGVSIGGGAITVGVIGLAIWGGYHLISGAFHSGGPPPPQIRESFAKVLAWDGDDERNKVREAISRYENDENVRRYMKTYDSIRDAFDGVDDLVVGVFSNDSYFVAETILQRLEKQAIASAVQTIEADMERIQRASGWGIVDNESTRAESQRKMDEIRRHERWLQETAVHAWSEASSHSNQDVYVPIQWRESEKKRGPKQVQLDFSNGFGNKTDIELKEGTALRQLRDVAKTHSWSGVLNERKKTPAPSSR